jgi:hypothetical protein
MVARAAKLFKFFGLWLLTSEHFTESLEWSAFYERWERAGCILEHLFLARIQSVLTVAAILSPLTTTRSQW